MFKKRQTKTPNLSNSVFPGEQVQSHTGESEAMPNYSQAKSL